MPWHGLITTSLINSYQSNPSPAQATNTFHSNLNKLSPYWVTGFSDAESTFSIRISKSKSSKTGWSINPVFAIELHKKDIAILEEIKTFFGVGLVYIRNTRNNAVFHVQSVEDLRCVIIPHFNKYSLLTQKKADFILFSSIIELILKNKHSDIKGLNKIIDIRSAMNNGLSDELKSAFPKFKPVQRPSIINESISDPYWLVGFVDGEGNFYVNKKKSSSKLGYQIILVFSIYQHSRDSLLLKYFIDYLECGSVEIPSTRLHSAKFVIYKFSDITKKIIPFFQKYSLRTVKLFDFYDFIKVSDLMKEGSHLTIEGIEKISLIKKGMNVGRDFK